MLIRDEYMIKGPFLLGTLGIPRTKPKAIKKIKTSLREADEKWEEVSVTLLTELEEMKKDLEENKLSDVAARIEALKGMIETNIK